MKGDMMKRKIILIVIIIISPVIIFNGYKFKVYNDFKGYLNEKYSDKTFNIHWVNYDFLNRSFTARVNCNNDDAEFTMSKHNSINEHYLLEKNKKPITPMINSYLKNGDFNTYIQDLIAGAEDVQLLDTKEKVDYNKLRYDVFIQYKYNSIIDHQQFAEISAQIISELKNNNVILNTISFDYEKDKNVFSLLLKENEINGQISDIKKSIVTRK
jgi:hypothetical protein